MQSLNIITERVLQYGLRLNFETHVFHKADVGDRCQMPGGAEDSEISGLRLPGVRGGMT